MTKLLAATAAVLMLSAGAATAGPRLATDGLPAASANTAYYHGILVPTPPHRTGLSYGTGYHGLGTATGGPAGGLPNRN